MDKFNELESLRKLYLAIMEHDLMQKRYRHLINEFVSRGRVLFDDNSLVMRQVYDKIYDPDVVKGFMNELSEMPKE